MLQSKTLCFMKYPEKVIFLDIFWIYSYSISLCWYISHTSHNLLQIMSNSNQTPLNTRSMESS